MAESKTQNLTPAPTTVLVYGYLALESEANVELPAGLNQLLLQLIDLDEWPALRPRYKIHKSDLVEKLAEAVGEVFPNNSELQETLRKARGKNPKQPTPRNSQVR